MILDNKNDRWETTQKQERTMKLHIHNLFCVRCRCWEKRWKWARRKTFFM